MANRSESVSPPPVVQRFSRTYQLVGWASFWVQIVLGVISAVVLLFAGSSLGASSGNPVNPTSAAVANPGTGAGLLFAVLGLLGLFVGAYWAFRYTRLSRRFKSPDPRLRLRPNDAVPILQFGLWSNLIGMLLTIFGGQAIAGSLVLKSFEQGFAIFSGNPLRFITPLDLFVVQANSNTVMAHFIGLIATLWLIRITDRHVKR
jgi:hypothetical protein